MQIRPRLGNSRLCVIRSFGVRNKKAALFARLSGLMASAHFSEATGPFEAAGSGSKPNTPTKYL